MKISGSIAARYHEATKYNPTTIGNLPDADVRAQPSPFKDYHTERAVDLIAHLPSELFPEAAERASAPGSPDPNSRLARLSRLLYFTYGATARKVWEHGHQIFRAAPSAGGLYPVEVYLATEGVEGAPDALHNYYVPNHQLSPVFDGEWISELSALSYGAFDPTSVSAVMVLTGVYARSIWRYHQRAYRRILLDTGHVFGNVAAYASHEGFDVLPISCFHDDGVNGAFFFDPEQEQAQLLVAIMDRRGGGRAPTAVDWRRDDEFGASANQDFLEYHRASALSKSPRPVPRFSPSTASGNRPPVDLEFPPTLSTSPMAQLILERRSTRRFSGESVSWEQLCKVLRAAYDGIRDQLAGGQSAPSLQTPELLRTHVLVRDVTGLAPGIYELDPMLGSLNLFEEGDHSEAALRFGLGQDLVGQAAAVVIHSADLTTAIEQYGERVYRSLHMDAGVIGQFMNLAAMHHRVGISGIGGFYDDMVNETLGLSSDHGIMYVTAIGASA